MMNNGKKNMEPEKEIPLDGPMVWVWCGWEPPQYYRRLGGFHEAQEGNALWSGQWFRLIESEDTAAKLSEAGINWVTTHFFKGFGLRTEAEDIARTERLIENYHKHNIRVFTYLQYGSIMPETIRAEEKQSRRWPRRDWNGNHDGPPYEYGDQYWRSKPCANQPGFREYLLKCVDKAIDIGADGIWIDNLQADGCHCPKCSEEFRRFVKDNVDDPWEDLGLKPEHLDMLTPPRAERPRDPVFQLWLRWRSEEVEKSLRMICERARQRKPEILIAANIGLGSGQRHLIDNGNWVSMLGLLDFLYAENGLFPRWNGEKIISQHYTMSIANAVGTHIVPGANVGTASRGLPRPTLPDKKQLRRCLAESAIHGAHAFGGPWGLRGENCGETPILLRSGEWRKNNAALADFYRRNWEIFSKSKAAEPVAVLYNFESLMADEKDYSKTLAAFEQMLMQNQIPFRYLPGDGIGDQLDDAAVLILPHVLPLAKDTEAKIRKWVENGGKILATGRCGLYDGWMRQRTNYAMADLFGVDFSSDFEDANHDSVIRNNRTGSVLLPGRWGLKTPQDRPACNIPAERVAKEINNMLPPHIPRIFSPLKHVGSGMRQLEDGRVLLGLVNYADRPVRGIEISLKDEELCGSEINVFDTTDDKHLVSPIRADDGYVRYRLPELEVEMFCLLPQSD